MGGAPRREGVGGDDEQGRAQARLELRKKSLAATERDEGKRRAKGSAPRNRGKNVTLVSSISAGGVSPSVSIEGPSDGEAFGLYLRRFLCPALRRGQIVVADDLSAHKGGEARRIVEEAGCELWFLPPLLAGPQPHQGGVLEGEGSTDSMFHSG